MKTLNNSIRGNIAAGLVSGLSLILGGGCGRVDFLPIGMPAEDPITGDRPTAVYESDIQDADISNRAVHDGFIDGVFEFGINPQYDGQPTAPVITPLRGGEDEPLPFDVTVTYNIAASGKATGGKLILTDNGMQNFRDDAGYRIDMTAATFICKGHSSPTESLVVSYNRGMSNANLEDQINPAIIACHTDADCNDSNPQTLDRCINPGAANSYCQNTPTTPTEDLLKQIDSYFVNTQGQRLNTVAINPATLRVKMPEALEQLLASGPSIIRTEENGVGDCIDIGSYTALTRTGPGIYDSTVTFTVGQGCRQDEVAAFVSSLSTTDGLTTNNIYGSAFIQHSIPRTP